MRIKISEIPENGLETEFTLKLKEIEGEAQARLTINMAGPDLYVTGNIDAAMSMNCGRCLKEYSGKFTVPVDITCLGELDDDDDEREEDSYCHEIEDGMLDLGNIAEEQVIINAPMKQICTEQCKGLCPKCGADLNEADCGCDNTKVDPRMQVLEKLLNKGEKNNG